MRNVFEFVFAHKGEAFTVGFIWGFVTGLFVSLLLL